MKKILLIGLVLMLLIPLATALVYEKGAGVDLKIPCYNNGTYCSGTTECNITIVYPNSSIMVNNQNMTNQLAYFNYTLPDTNATGNYYTSMVCNDNENYASSTFEFEITGNGKEKPEGITILFFSVLFLLILGSFTYFVIDNIGGFVLTEYTIKKVALNFGYYFIVFGTYMLHKEFFGFSEVDKFLLLAIQVGAVTNIVLPVIAFGYSYFRLLLTKKRGY